MPTKQEMRDIWQPLLEEAYASCRELCKIDVRLPEACTQLRTAVRYAEMALVLESVMVDQVLPSWSHALLTLEDVGRLVDNSKSPGMRGSTPISMTITVRLRNRVGGPVTMADRLLAAANLADIARDSRLFPGPEETGLDAVWLDRIQDHNPGRVLVAEAFQGRLIDAVSETFPHAEIWACDHSPASIRFLAKQYPSSDPCRWCPVEHPTEVVDPVDLLLLTPPEAGRLPEVFCNQAWSMVAPGGIMVASLPRDAARLIQPAYANTLDFADPLYPNRLIRLFRREKPQ